MHTPARYRYVSPGHGKTFTTNGLCRADEPASMRILSISEWGLSIVGEYAPVSYSCIGQLLQAFLISPVPLILIHNLNRQISTHHTSFIIFVVIIIIIIIFHFSALRHLSASMPEGQKLKLKQWWNGHCSWWSVKMKDSRITTKPKRWILSARR